MSVISQQAENKLKELGKTLSPAARKKLATYNEDDQVRWIVNPMVMFCLQRVQNQIWADLQTRKPVRSTTQTKPVPKRVVDQPDPTPEPEPDPDPDSDVGGMFDLFGD